MNELVKLRKHLSLSLAILLIVIIVFISYSGNKIIELSNSLDDMQNYAQDQKEEFLYLSKDIQYTFVDTIEEGWKSRKEDFESFSTELFLQRFYLFLDGVLNQAYSSMIIMYDEQGNEKYKRYVHEEYSKYIYSVMFNEKSHKNIPYRETRIINGEKDKPFGEGNRLYYTGVELEKDEHVFIIYIFFHEQVMFEEMVNPLNVELLEQIDKEANSVLLNTGIFLIFIVVYGTYLLFYMRIFHKKSYSAKCIYYGNKYCKSFIENEKEI